MDLTADWKSLWPISSTFSAPLLIPNKITETSFGPLIFKAKPNSSTTLLNSPSLSPQLPPPYPQLPLSRFLQNYNSVPSSAAAITSLGHQLPNYSSYFHGFNALQLLQIPTKNLIVVFFPTGENSDHVGFSLLSLKEGHLNVRSQGGNIFELVKEGSANHHRITRLLVNPVDDFCGDVNGDNNKHDNVVTAGFLMVCTSYSVCWYRVGITTLRGQDEYSVCVDYLGCANIKMLRGNRVAGACWSPHLREECLVLLDNGDLLLFDVSYYYGEKAESISLVRNNNNVVKKIIYVSLTNELGSEKEESGNEGRCWFECEFSWHPRIFIASHNDAVFLVDLRSSVHNISCLLKLETLSMGKNDEFCALSRAGSDGFTFTVSTRNLLLLFDVRKPLAPILRWAHDIRNPRYLTVFRLLELRANAGDRYKLASESGYCVVLGSFWDSQFSLFCYGPDCRSGNKSVSSEISKFCNLCYAWGLPSEFSLSGSDCKCGSCLVREEFLKASQPAWIDWRQKKHLNLGFSILNPSLSAQLCSFDSFGGFILIRLTSSGKLEMQQYFAAYESKNITEAGHKRKKCYLQDNLLFDCNPSDYVGAKKFQHLKLDFLNAYLEGNLANYVAQRRVRGAASDENAQKKYKSDSNFHEEICHRLKAFGLQREQSSCEISAVLKDIHLPTSIHEIALRSMCSVLPTSLLKLAFSTYTDFNEDLENHKEPLEFLEIPEQIHGPPFSLRKPSQRSNKWSSKVKRSDSLVGPVLPPVFLTTLHNVCLEELKEERDLSKEYSVQAQLKDQCDKVVQVVKEQFSGADTKSPDEDFVSLADDTEDMSLVTEKLKFSCHKPSSFLESPSDVSMQKPRSDYMFSSHVFRRSQEVASEISADMTVQEIFDVGCPIELKFDEISIEFGEKEAEIFRELKKRDLDFQRSYKPYQDYITGQDELKQE
ncbi:hypothetical protein ABFS83_14G263900 [Erythranthe nasuta]